MGHLVFLCDEMHDVHVYAYDAYVYVYVVYAYVMYVYLVHESKRLFAII